MQTRSFKGISTRNIFVGDICLAKFPYSEKGNFYKIRPALVLGYTEEGNILMQKITSNKNKGVPFSYIPNKSRKPLGPSYLTEDKTYVPYYNVMFKLGRIQKGKR